MPWNKEKVTSFAHHIGVQDLFLKAHQIRLVSLHDLDSLKDSRVQQIFINFTSSSPVLPIFTFES